MSNIFFDNASTTRVSQRIMDQLPILNEKYYYNPSSLYSVARESRGVIEKARSGILSRLVGVKGSSLIFTGSATEANNMALFGSVKKNTRKILISVAEHPSVYNPALELKNQGYNVEFVKINKCGIVDIEDFKSKLDSSVDFVSVMHVNNETGAVNDIEMLCSLVKKVNPNCIFHCDGVQAVGKVEVDLEELGVDLYSMSAHKIYGFKGTGALYIKNNSKIKPYIFGGGQEGGYRSGTENIIGICSLAMAVEDAVKDLKNNIIHYKNLKSKLLELLRFADLQYEVHSCDDNVANIVSISFKNCRAETLLNMLSDRGVFVANGSACSSKKSGNRILESMGVDKSGIEGNLRISFSIYNTIEEIVEFVEILKVVVKEYLSKAR